VSAETYSIPAPRSAIRSFLAREKYIVSPLFDWVFFIGSPLFSVGAVHGAMRFFSEASIAGFIMTFMAVGHHVPTFLRAYADPDEFQRHKVKLTFVPPLVLVVMGFLVFTGSPLLPMIFIWDQYHFVRQHYGFMRIYDAKNGSIKQTGPNLDLWLCFSLFIFVLARSDLYAYVYGGSLFELGLPPPSWLGPLLYQVAAAVAIAVVSFFAIDLVRRIRDGEKVSGLKVVVTITTYSVWYYAYVVFDNFYLSYGISSLFHCMQYDAIAWHYNKSKAASMEATPGNALFRFMHQGRHLWAYVLAILSYGGVSLVLGGMAPAFVLMLNRTTGVLHYYYDAFIWKVRRVDVRRHLV
jgi:hypothetical protein